MVYRTSMLYYRMSACSTSRQFEKVRFIVPYDTHFSCLTITWHFYLCRTHRKSLSWQKEKCVNSPSCRVCIQSKKGDAHFPSKLLVLLHAPKKYTWAGLSILRAAHRCHQKTERLMKECQRHRELEMVLDHNLVQQHNADVYCVPWRHVGYRYNPTHGGRQQWAQLAWCKNNGGQQRRVRVCTVRGNTCKTNNACLHTSCASWL